MRKKWSTRRQKAGQQELKLPQTVQEDDHKLNKKLTKT